MAHLDGQEIIAIEDTPKPAKKTSGRRTGEKWHNNDLPEGCSADNLWCKTFIPTYLSWIGQQEDSWTVSDADAKVWLQKIWQVVYGKKLQPYKIKTDGPVFAIVSPISVSEPPGVSTSCHCSHRPNNASQMPGDRLLAQLAWPLLTHFLSQSQSLQRTRIECVSHKRALRTLNSSTPMLLPIIHRYHHCPDGCH
jgi:hypothetical protein